MKGTCQLLPFAAVQEACVANIDKNYPDIYNMIRDNTDPGVVCRVTKVCEDEHMIEKPKNKEIEIKIVNPEDTVLSTPFNTDKQKHLLGSKTETLVAQVLKTP